MNDHGAAPHRHLTLDELADLGADLLAPDRAAWARHHLAGCAACRATEQGLTELPAVLTAAGDLTMPTEVADRISAALATAGRERAAAPQVLTTAGPVSGSTAARTDDASSSPVGDLAAARARRTASSRWGRAGAALVGVAAVLGGGFLFVQTDLGGGADGASDTAGVMADRDLGATSPGEESGTGGAPAEEPGLVDAPLTATALPGLSYSEATLGADATRLLETEQTAALNPREGPATGGDSTDTTDSPTVTAAASAACVDAVAERARGTTETLAVDVGTYEGRTAVVVVRALRSSEAAAAEVWVVDAGCLTAPEGATVEVLQRADLVAVP